MKKSISILNTPTNEIDIILDIALQLCKDTINPKSVPWITNIYFAGATLFIDGYYNNEKDSMTICHSDETVGYFSGGLRKLISIKGCKLLEEILVLTKINHETKWLK